MSFSAGQSSVPVAGVDVGSTLTKAVVIDLTGRVLGSSVVPTGGHVGRAAARGLADACKDAQLASAAPVFVVATGYGRFQVKAGHEVVPEIACHGRGAAAIWPGVATLIDIGGQDTKVMRVAANGRVRDFRMNDKCAAGTGRFLDGAAEVLGMSREDMGRIAEESRTKIAVSSVCAVFAESEIGALLADGVPIPHVVAGLTDAVARRVVALAGRIEVVAPVAMSGGVSRNPAVVADVARRLALPVAVSPRGILAGAHGAALIAADRALGVLPGASQERRVVAPAAHEGMGVES